MNAKVLSGVTAIALAAASMSLEAATAVTVAPDGQLTATNPAPSDKAASAADDAALVAQVKSAIQSEPALRSQAIEVDSKDATITLIGSVDSAASKARANEVAASVNGVVAVVDQLTITA